MDEHAAENAADADFISLPENSICFPCFIILVFRFGEQNYDKIFNIQKKLIFGMMDKCDYFCALFIHKIYNKI